MAPGFARRQGFVKLRKQRKTWLPWRTWWQSQRLRLRRDLILVNQQVRLLSLLIKHPEVPWPAKITGGCAIAYIFSPIQLIPSFIPIVGQMDDLLVVYLGTRIMRKFAPAAVLNQCEALAHRASSAQIERWEHTLRDLRQNRASAA
jgi:uncharacterized membrane protein YkvA (DUF1232 family)